MERLSWWRFVYGLLLVAIDFFLQRIRCVSLPRRLPLQSLSHLTVIVTGATSGIGLETARELAKAGAHVVLAVRNTAAGEGLVRQWEKDQAANGGPSVNAEVLGLHLLSLASVRSFARRWLEREAPLNVLINNAGIFCIGGKQRFSEDGFEHHIQVNHLGHALLSLLLLPSLICGGPSRIINVNSEMHHAGFPDFEDLNLSKRKFYSVLAYSSSKMAQFLFSRMLHMMVPKEAGVDVILVHPGEVMTGVSRDLPILMRKAEERITSVFRFTPLEGARSVLFCATDQQVYQYARALRQMGYPIAPYFSSDCRPAKVAHLANDMEYAKQVWDKTLELVGLPNNYLERALANKNFFDQQDDAQHELA